MIAKFNAREKIENSRYPIFANKCDTWKKTFKGLFSMYYNYSLKCIFVSLAKMMQNLSYVSYCFIFSIFQ